MSPADPERLERLTEELRTLRARLADPQTDPLAWELDLYSYDFALVTVADLIDLPLHEGVREEMGSEARADLEVKLAAAGVDAWDDGGDGGGTPGDRVAPGTQIDPPPAPPS